MFGVRSRQEAFEREVCIEIDLLRKFHGENAARVAAEKAVRPTNRTLRRKVLEEAARRLAGESAPARKGLINRLLGA
ncbi:MAG: hypothetical protein Q8L23_06100 [Caulobacter sp.]|nr:hypothetical protein [Caulobacter sp.]